MKKGGLLQKIKYLDIYPKFSEEAVEQNSAGGIISILGALILVFLMLSEIGEYMFPKTQHYLYANYHRNEKMLINVRILFHNIPCDMVNFDVSEKSGAEEVGVNRKSESMAMFPFYGNFTQIYENIASRHSKDYYFETKLWTALKLQGSSNSQKCLPCHEAAMSKSDCCNHCYTLIKAFMHKGLNPEEALKYQQCTPEAESIGCMVTGFLNVSKGQGSFHIAAGDPHMDPRLGYHHHHWEDTFRRAHLNISHYLSHLSFGKEFPGIVNPLDGFLFVDKTLGQQQYFIQVVPTIYQRMFGRKIETNQYSATYHFNAIEDIKAEHVELPGIYFKYDLSPIAINISERRASFGHFITRLMAVLGGVWVMIGVFYKFAQFLFGLIEPPKKTM